MNRVRVFVDFWNFQLAWNYYLTAEQRCNWKQLPMQFVAQGQQVLAEAGMVTAMQLEETRVHPSYDPKSESGRGLQKWLNDFLDRQPSFRVFPKERSDKPTCFYCRECKQEFTVCPSCGKALMRSPEKGVDTAIVTDLLSLAWEGAYDIAILVSSDADMIPCVERLQEKDFKVINATWPKRGHALAKACWASFNIMDVVDHITRP